MTRIAFLIDAVASLTTEQTAAWRFLSAQRRLQAKRIRFDRLPSVDELRRSYDLIWWHTDTGPTLPIAALDERSTRTIRSYVERGGSLLLSLSATSYAVDLGFESVRPSVNTTGAWTEESWAKDYPDIRGFAPFLGHPLFHDTTGGAYTWMPSVGTPFAASYYEGTLPASASVLAVERRYIKVVPERRMIWEHSPRRGHVLSIGAFFQFAETQPRVRGPLEHLFLNTVAYLTTTRPKAGRANTWQFESASPVLVERFSRPVSSPRKPIPWPETPPIPEFRRERRHDETGDAFDVGGRRCVMLGHEQTGIREVWCHPLRILRDVRTSFIVNGGAGVSASDLQPEIVTSPAGVTRRFLVGEALIEETTFADPTYPAGCIRYRIGADCDVRVIIDAEVDLRLMWPLDERATGGLRYAWDEGLNAAVVTTISGEFASIFGSSVKPLAQLSAPCQSLRYGGNAWSSEGDSLRSIRIGLTLRWQPGDDPLSVVIAGSGTSEREAELAYRAVMASPSASYVRQTTAVQEVTGQHVAIDTPDGIFNDLYVAALLGTDRFYLETPGLGRSYVAGYGTVERGWDGGQAVSGRPGYAWYFGRDSVWTAFAALAGGLHDRARTVVEFLGRHQDLSGKILHELTTSGYSHFDAADATPLYVILFGRYVRASGHVSFARREFAQLERAMEFCLSTDTDGDGLIENTNVGHGWVEGGGLFPVHTEHYLASCWAEALREAASVADMIGRPAVAKKWNSMSRSVRSTIETDFWNNDAGTFRFAKMQDGSWRNDVTILPTVGLGFGIGTPEQGSTALRPLSGDEFTADWGVRIIGRSNSMFNPKGYHTGSVWPLFTGWTALAEFRYDRPLQGFLHTASTMLTSTVFSSGAVEEVLHGSTLTPAGVCSRQAWSESMIIQPLLEGMLGIDADGAHHRLSLRPWFPPQWNTCTIRRIRVGTSIVSFSMNREAGLTTLEFSHEGRSAVDIRLALRFPLGTVIDHVLVGKKRVAVESTMTMYDDAPTVGFRLTSKTTLTYHHRGGMGMIPVLTPLKAGAESRGPRLLDERMDEGSYILELEWSSGSENAATARSIDVWHAERTIAVEGATVERIVDSVSRVAITDPVRGAVTLRMK